ncbi:hypothetical protein QJS10_CPB13g00179 [Acorus calamus]|uniref:CCG-binding protein 1 n=1 Tax=Acorus calamus TaxID=4465 RepID=A0AAV9DIF2_ACOCL|nr:hypothetical protein QJS10_CPB13g00179 [Acorus calamus]
MIAISSSSPNSRSLLCESIDHGRPSHRSRSTSSIPMMVCGSNRSSVPKLGPFSRSKIDRGLKDPPFIQRCESELSDYCSTLEGDASYSCWTAYFELKDLEKELSKDDIEKLIRQCGGVKTLIDVVHGIAAMDRKIKKDHKEPKKTKTELAEERHSPIPDGLPKTQEELEEEEKARMPDSPFTRLLRSKGTHPAWYGQVPDHETD